MRAVRAVRAGEAKLCERVSDVLLVAGPWKCKFSGGAAASVVFYLLLHMWVLYGFRCFSGPRAC